MCVSLSFFGHVLGGSQNLEDQEEVVQKAEAEQAYSSMDPSENW